MSKKHIKNPNIKASLAGFNLSKKANRETVDTFIASYEKRFPDNTETLAKALPDLYDWLESMLEKGRPEGSPKSTPKPSVKPTLSAQPAWVPREFYIPEYANPRINFKRQATNIAQAMRKVLDAQDQDL